MNTIIQSFSIKGLFGTTDFSMPFNSKAKILIGENGLGKTQILNMLYYTLMRRFERLLEYSFESITLVLHNEDPITIRKIEIEQQFHTIPVVKEVIEKIGMAKFLEVYNLFPNGEDMMYETRRNSSKRRVIENLPISNGMLAEALDSFSRSNKKQRNMFDSHLDSHRIAIERALKESQVLYFPTYRRVEEDLHNLGYDEERFGINREDTRLINFGMDDVDRKFSEITQQIERLSKEGLSKISSEILSQLVKGIPQVDKDFLKTIDNQDIEIILARVGNQITDDDKLKIKSIVETKEIEAKNNTLLYFLQKLIKIYDQQRELDNYIKSFRDVCNKYLANKELIYDESSLEIFLRVKGNLYGPNLKLSKLSSGEKQIISIFSKIYLAPTGTNFVVLFDEPELSLSIFWQRQLLPDIFRSEKCRTLLAVTHSPFIFENELDEFAIDLSQYLNPTSFQPEIL